VEKQNAEQGLMPVLEDEAGVYGYTDENRHMVEAFRRGCKARTLLGKLPFSLEKRHQGPVGRRADRHARIGQPLLASGEEDILRLRDQPAELTYVMR